MSSHSAYDPYATARAGVVLPPSPQVRLVPAPQPPAPRQWEHPLPDVGRWKVRGIAGSGKTSFLVDAAVASCQAGADPSGILVITASKESGSRLRRELSVRLDDFAAQATMVRSVHSLAFSLLRKAFDVDIRLITGAEQDAVIRELLEGNAADGGGQWPEELRPALTYVGFARQLRDFLLRAIERGQGPDDLVELGERYRRPVWRAAGEFLREYERTMALAGMHSFSASELVNQVLMRPELTQQHPWHTVIVDDAQLLDPMSGRLVEELAASARLVVIAGDPDQAVFGFRGATTGFFDSFAVDRELTLDRTRRSSTPACVAIAGSRSAHSDVVVDTVRRRHLEDGIDWRDIAVIVRSAGDIGQIRRALLAAGVPVHIDPTDVVLAEQRLVAATLQVMRALDEELTAVEWEELITGPVGGADPVTLRRLIRGLRRWRGDRRGIDTLREVLNSPQLPDFEDKLTDRELAILQRVRAVLGAGHEAKAAGGSIEEILWAVWYATGLAERLQAAALRGGATGSQADRDLDAMMALFDAAGDFTERRPAASVAAFLAHITEQELPTGVRDRRVAAPQAVSVLTAHGSVGREWDTVVVAGAQEGQWPSLGETGSLLGQEDLIDLLDSGIEPDVPVSHLTDRLVQERRLFHVATTRHTARLTIVAIDAQDSDEVAEPSRFIEEFSTPALNWLAALAQRETNARLRNAQWPKELKLSTPALAGIASPVQHGDAEVDPLGGAILSVPSFVAQLRRVVCNPEAGESERTQAARQLARLASAGVPGAHPNQWWNARETSGNVPLRRSAALSPSKLEKLMQCPLNALLSDVAEDRESTFEMDRGSMAHAFLEAYGRGADYERARALTLAAFEEIVEDPAWKRQKTLDSFADMLDKTKKWVDKANGSYELVGTEVRVDVEVAPNVRLHGYIDRLERSADGGYRVVDLKTGKSPVTKLKAAESPQLAAYQLAISRGSLAAANSAEEAKAAGGEWLKVVDVIDGQELDFVEGVLVYPGVDSKGAAEREQARWEDERLDEFAARLPDLLAETVGPRLAARECDACDRCSLRTVCPVQNEGRMTTNV